MVNDVYEALCKGIKVVFPNEKIFKPPVEQGMQKASFIIALTSVKSQPLPSRLTKYSLEFSIKKYDEDVSNLYDCSVLLHRAVELVSLDEDFSIRGYIKEQKIEKETLTLTVQYSFSVREGVNKDYMGELLYAEQ